MALFIASPASVADEIQAEFFGKWATNARACADNPVLIVAKDQITVRYEKFSHAYKKFAACFTCAGNIRYSGIEVWYSPLPDSERIIPGEPASPENRLFNIRFNADEKKDTARIEEVEDSVPLPELRLVKCK